MREENFWYKKPCYSEVRVITRRVIARYDCIYILVIILSSVRLKQLVVWIKSILILVSSFKTVSLFSSFIKFSKIYERNSGQKQFPSIEIYFCDS